jgi:acyl-CoA thioesterase-1
MLFNLHISLLFCFFTLPFLSGCSADFPHDDLNPDAEISDSTVLNFRYLALGDSYTIGEGVSKDDSYPAQLVNYISQQGILSDTLQIIARTGWTTSELQNQINKVKPTQDWDVVTLLIGVNNQYRQQDFSVFEREFESLLSQAIDFAKGDPKRVFVISIPDYGVTPFGASRNQNGQVSKDIDKYNAYKKLLCERFNVAFFDITPISRLASNDSSLLAPDRLHPSGKMYAEWVKVIGPEVSSFLKTL